MALNTTANTQITDSVTQANVKIIGDAPALSLANLYRIVSQAFGLAVQNAVKSQQRLNTIPQAAVDRK